MRVAVTCLQLIRDIGDARAAMEAAGFELLIPEIRGQHLEGDALVAALEECVGVVAGDDRFTADVLARLPELRAISKWGVGVDGIDREAAAARGVTVTNTPGMFDDEVADVAMAYAITLLRQLHAVNDGVKRGQWPKPAGRSAKGLRMGIVGLGGIGRALAGYGHQRIVAVEILLQDAQTLRNGFRAQQRAGGMSLKVPVAIDQPGVVAQNLGHFDFAAKQPLGTVDYAYRRKMLRALLRDGRAVGVDDDTDHFRASKQRANDVMEQRPVGERPVVLARHALAGMAHGNECDDVHGRFPVQRRGFLKRHSNPRG